MLVSWFVHLYICLFHNFGVKVLIFFHVTLPLVRIEHDQILKKSFFT